MTDREATKISIPSNRFLNVSLQILVWIAVIGGLYLSSLYSYTLFHSIIEIFSIIVSSCIFLIVWNSRRLMDSNYMLFLAISLLFIAIIDILHTLAYKGMGVFQGYDANLPTQLWIIMRYMLAISFLMAPIFIRKKVNAPLVLFLYSAATVLLLLFVFYWGTFPACYIEGAGLTPFKIYSEYIISLILLGSLIYLILERKAFARSILGLLIGAIILSIAAEMAFTTYASVYGFSNMLGHMLVFVSFYLIYKALIEIGLTKPYDLMFRNLKNSEKKNRIILEQMYESYFEVDLAGNFTRVNESTCLNLGYSPEELIGKNYRFTVPGDNIKPLLLAFNEVFQTGEPNQGFEHKILRKDGSIMAAESSISLLKNERGDIIGFRSLSQNITERKKAEDTLRSAEEKYRSLVENINDVFYTLDNQGNITYVSPVVERFTLYKVSDLIGKPFIPLIYPDDLPGLLDSFNRMVSGQLEPWEFRILDKDGRIIFVRTSSRPIYEDGEIVGVTALMTDITRRKQMEQKLEELATHDFLTGLPNRVLLLDRFNVAAALAHRNKARLAVMSLDLDKFKLINDVYGHGAGDQVLKVISTRLMGIIRSSDTLARIGGDEFILVTMESSRMEDAAAVAQKILDSFKEPLLIDGNHLYVSTSIGIAIYPEDGQDLESLIKKSDAAMYYSKGHGRNQFKFFSDGDIQVS